MAAIIANSGRYLRKSFYQLTSLTIYLAFFLYIVEDCFNKTSKWRYCLWFVHNMPTQLRLVYRWCVCLRLNHNPRLHPMIHAGHEVCLGEPSVGHPVGSWETCWHGFERNTPARFHSGWPSCPNHGIGRPLRFGNPRCANALVVANIPLPKLRYPSCMWPSPKPK